MKILKSHDDWLQARSGRIGGSDASAVVGMNPYKNNVELWMEKTNQAVQSESGEAAYWGTQLESLVRSEFTKRTGIEVKQTYQLLQSAEHPFMLANLDGVCEHPDHGTCIFEAKTASAYKANEWEDTIPDELKIISKSEDDGEVMAVKHKEFNVYGLQFHPESILTPDGLTIMENFLNKL